MKISPLVLAFLAFVPGFAPARAGVPRWEPSDFPFTSASAPVNPFTVTFSATVSGPGGVMLTVPGFYDGGATWKVRVSPTVEGAWTLTTHSTVADLDGKSASFTCVTNANAKVHGGLRVDPARPHHFVFEDGARFFPMGYECDWLWALDLASGDPALPVTAPFLDRIAASGFNYVILNGYAHDTSWRSGTTGADDYGPPPLYAWAGTNAAPDHSRMNVTYWQRYDRAIDALYRRGMIAHMLIKVYNKSVNWPTKASADDDLYFGWLVARYAAYPNIVWDFSKEAQNESDVAYKQGRLGFIKARDPYQRLRTVHDDDASYASGAYNGLADYHSDQNHGGWRTTILSQRQQRAWPIVNVEFGYEQGPGGANDKTYGVAQAPEEVVRRAWEICMAGGYTAYYYTYTAWDVVRPQDQPPGYAYFKRLRDFFESTSYWRLDPADNVASQGWCLAELGKEYVVYVNPGQNFTLNIQGAASPLQAQWYQPLTGATQNAGSLANGVATLQIPAGWNLGPAVLHAVNTASVAPTISTQPTNAAVTSGQTASFNVVASGTAPLSYQWQKNGTTIAGATSSSYTTPATTLGDNGATFRCVVTNSVGSATSNNATLTVTASATSPSITSQPASQAVTVGQTATFSVTASGTAPLAYQWQKNGVNVAGATSASYTTPATTLADNGSTFHCIVTNGAGSATSLSATLTVSPSLSSLPSPWLDQDIGAVGMAGSASYSGGTFTLSGAGADIWGTADAFHFVYQTLSGDGEIIAQVSGLGNTNPWAKAGVMIRETLTAASANAMMVVTPGNGTSFQRRTATGGTSTLTAGPAATVPYWVRLLRSGSTFTAYASSDGVTWTLVGTDTIPMAASVYIGLVLTSHANTVLDTAMVSSVSGSGGWSSGGGGGGTPPPVASGGGGGGHGGGCGATGMESVLLLGLLSVIRKRKKFKDKLRLPGSASSAPSSSQRAQ